MSQIKVEDLEFILSARKIDAVLIKQIVKDAEEAAEQAKNPKYTPVNPWLVLLKYASTGKDLETRGAIQANVRPSKPIDLAKAREAMAKKMVASGMAKSMESAYKKLAILEASDEDAA